MSIGGANGRASCFAQQGYIDSRSQRDGDTEETR